MGSRDDSASRDTDRDTAETDTDNMDAFKGKYERTSADKYEEMLKELDVNFLLRKAATVSTPVCEITEDGGVWTIKTSTTLKTMELKFKLGEEFDETTPDGRQVTATVTCEDGKIISVQKAKKKGEEHQVCARDERGGRDGVHHDH